MRYLDETIKATVTTGVAGRATFIVYWRANANATATAIYHGILYTEDATSVSIDVTDILASYRHDWDILTSERATSTSVITDWVGQFYVAVTFGTTTYTNDWDDVALLYRNPELLCGFTADSLPSLVQGGLTPRIPDIDSDLNYASALSLDYTEGTGYTVTLRSYSTPSLYPTLFETDTCAARYYLRWIDRWGGMQSQPFTGKIVHSEDITRTNVTNYAGVRRLVQAEVTPKWSLNTGWIDETEMPLYEAAFVSPYAALYDTTLGIVYNVLITDKTYTKKTYKNNKLFNLALMVEQSKKQSIRN